MGKSKLKKSDARAIRHSDETRTELAQRYGVSVSTIRQIQLGQKWKNAGGPIRKPQPTGVLWAPSDTGLQDIISGLEIRGAWMDGAAAAGVTASTLQAYGGRVPEHGDIMRAAIERGIASVAAREKEQLGAVISARAKVKSWGAAAAAVGLTTSAVNSLRAKYPSTEPDCRAATEAGQANYDRELLSRAAGLIGSLGSWVKVSRALGVTPTHLADVRQRNPKIEEELVAAMVPHSAGFVYVVRDGYGMIKVGRASDVMRRVGSIRCGNSSGEIDVLFAAEVADPGCIERRIHERLAGSWIHGEWFDVDAGTAVAAAEEESGKTTQHTQQPERPKKKKLNANKVREIRASDEPVAVLAERYGVSTSTIRDVRFGRKWTKVGGRILTPSKSGVKWEPPF